MNEKILEIKTYLESGGFNVLINQYLQHPYLLTRYVNDHHSTSIVGKIISQSYQSEYRNFQDMTNQYYIIPYTVKRKSFKIPINFLKDWNRGSFNKWFIDDKQLSLSNDIFNNTTLEYVFSSDIIISGMKKIYETVIRLMEIEDDFDFESIDLKLSIGYIEQIHISDKTTNILIYPIIENQDIENRHIIKKSHLDYNPDTRDGNTYNIDDCLDRMLKQ